MAAAELKNFAPAAQSRLVFDDTGRMVADMKKHIKKIEKEILAVIKEHDELRSLYYLVTSVRGIGPVIGATLLVHTNAFKAFRKVRLFASYRSVAPFEQSSGKSIRIKAKVSPLGNRKIKALLTNAARNVIRTDKQLKAYYESRFSNPQTRYGLLAQELEKREIAEGKRDQSVLNAVKFKLLARVFAVVERGTPFVEGDTFRA